MLFFSTAVLIFIFLGRFKNNTMKFLVCLFLLLCSEVIFGQGDLGVKTSLSLPSGSLAPKTTTIAPKAPSIFDTPIPKTDNAPLKVDKPLNLSQQNNFVDPNTPHVERLNKREGNEAQKAIRKDQYLGDFKTKVTTVMISYRDAAAVDGDLIKIYVNGTIVRAQAYLDADFRGFQLGLELGFNKIEFEALNQGSSGPNTAEMLVTDEKGNQLNSGSWNLATGFKASIIIIRE